MLNKEIERSAPYPDVNFTPFKFLPWSRLAVSAKLDFAPVKLRKDDKFKSKDEL